MSHRFLPDSGHSSGFWLFQWILVISADSSHFSRFQWIPEELKMAEQACGEGWVYKVCPKNFIFLFSLLTMLLQCPLHLTHPADTHTPHPARPSHHSSRRTTKTSPHGLILVVWRLPHPPNAPLLA